MQYQMIPYVWFLFISALIALGLCFFAWWRRSVRGAIPFLFLMIEAVIWVAANAMEVMGLDLPTKIFWNNVQFSSYSFSPLTWLVLTLQYTGKEWWLTRRRTILLLIIPVITVILVWTNDRHGLMHRDIYGGPFPVMGQTYGLWFWVLIAYCYLLIIISCIIHVKSVLSKQRLYRMQVLALWGGLLLPPVICSVLFSLKLSPLKYDLAPAFISIGGLIMAWGLFRFKLLDVLPAARDMVIESMDDGMLIFDELNRIVDFNPAAQKIIGFSSDIIGKEAAAVLKDHPAWEELSRISAGVVREVQIKGPGRTGYYHVRQCPINNRRGRINGRLLVLHDITESKLAQREILRHQRSVVIMEEREKLSKDLHDNLGQVFGFINVQAQAIKHELKSAGIDTASHKLAKLVEVAQSAHREMREYIQNVKSATAAQKNFVPAVKKEIEQYIKQTGIDVKLYVSDEPLIEGLEPHVKMHMSNIAKEALNNIRKYAEAKNVSIEVKADGNEILVVIEDGGRGFDVMKYKKEPAHGLGLNIMRERAGEIGGEIRIDSAPGNGTRIFLRVPLKEVVNENESQADQLISHS